MSVHSNSILRRGLLSASVLAMGLGVAACGNSTGERALSGGAIGAGGGAAGAATGALTDADDLRLD